jgi:glyoxylase-like metal-dependent hydrolase (beta-lactamase superfamily II)
VRDDLWLFAPSRDSQGGSAWLLATAAGDLLIDCPGYTDANLAFLAERARGGPGRIVLTGRDGHGRVRRLQQALGWTVLVQEQEGYLLPGVAPLQTFADALELAPGLRLLWTPGPSPGSCVLHAAPPAITGTPLLFCGRLLVPVAPERLAPLASRRTFHWGRQRRSLERLRAWLPAEGPLELATGAGLGALRGGRLVPDGLESLASLRQPAPDAAPPQGL